MDVFLNNFNFLLFNTFLALIPVLFGWLMSKANSVFAKTWTGFVWFVFLPNTIYLLTDVTHLFEDWSKVDALFKLILVIQYSLFSMFGIISFVISVYFFQKIMKKQSKTAAFAAICILNFMVGFAVILGGIERASSWHIFTDPIRVANDVLDVLSSKEMLMLSIGIGLLANVIYFFFVETVATWGKKFTKK